MDFSDALRRIKRGAKLARRGWNGSGQFVYRVGEGRYDPTTDVGNDIAADQPDGKVPYRPYYALKTVQGDIATWVPSSSDMDADDWVDVTHGEGDLDG